MIPKCHVFIFIGNIDEVVLFSVDVADIWVTNFLRYPCVLFVFLALLTILCDFDRYFCRCALVYCCQLNKCLVVTFILSFVSLVLSKQSPLTLYFVVTNGDRIIVSKGKGIA